MAREGEAPPTIVFDVDGTLVDSAEDLVATLNAVGSREGLPAISLTEGKRLVGGGARAMIERAFAAHGRPLDAAALDRLTEACLAYYRVHMVDHSRTYPGAMAALDGFVASGWRLAVCTNKLEAIARELLERLGLDTRFAAIAGQDTFGFRKPDPRHLIETIRLAGGTPERAVMVGDSQADVDAARAARIPVVAVTFGYSPVPVANLRADAVVEDYRDLWAAVAALAVAWTAAPLAPAVRRPHL
jgi:phosphoglycolate phosphatase